jgi:hypothetical protein
MLRKGLLLIASLAPIFASPAARADICFQYDSGGGILVAKGAALPAEDACLPVALVDQGVALGMATGSICTGGDPQGTGVPSLVFQYTYTACTLPAWFEAGTCRIELNVTGGFPRGDLPSEKQPGQKSGCNIVFATMDANATAPLKQATDSSLKAWKCNIPSVAHGDASTCQKFGGPFSHPKPPLDGGAATQK